MYNKGFSLCFDLARVTLGVPWGRPPYNLRPKQPTDAHEDCDAPALFTPPLFTPQKHTDAHDSPLEEVEIFVGPGSGPVRAPQIANQRAQ